MISPRNSESRTVSLTTKVTPKMHHDFCNKVHSLGGTSVVIREFIQAFLENRLSVEPPKESFYVPRSKNR